MGKSRVLRFQRPESPVALRCSCQHAWFDGRATEREEARIGQEIDGNKCQEKRRKGTIIHKNNNFQWPNKTKSINSFAFLARGR